MKVTVEDNYTILTDERDTILDFAKYLEAIVPKNYDQHNLIIDLLQYDKLTLDELVAFINLSNYQRADKKSFVFVNTDIDYDIIPDEVIFVPTVQEAIDVIGMEEIERDLGF